MNIVVGILNLGLGMAYTTYGILTLADMKRGWSTMGFSHFGAAWVAMAFTCGPHHLEHGLHNLAGRHGGPLDLLAVVVGLPMGVGWLYLRIEAFRGGRGDRFITGTPGWLRVLPFVGATYLALLAAASFTLLANRHLTAEGVPNLLLLVIYMAIGYFLARTQLAQRGPTGGWSASGLALVGIFPTCALMHTVFLLYTTSGRYVYDVHGVTIDTLAVPAGLYFLWVVRSLYLGTLRDWNRTEGASFPLAAAIS